MVDDAQNKPDQPEDKAEPSSLLVGLGFDHTDKHKRITEGDNFLLAGGSARTHDLMLGQVLKFNEILKKEYGKPLEQLTRAQYELIVRQLGANPIQWKYWDDLYADYLKTFYKKNKRF